MIHQKQKRERPTLLTIAAILRTHWAIATVLMMLIPFLLFLANPVFTHDTASWFENSYSFYMNGYTGFQFRNILFSYILAIPLFLKLPPAQFILILSGLSFIATILLLYKINLRFSGRGVAALTSLIFALTFIFLRHATQIWSDILTMFFVMLTLFSALQVILDKRREFLIGLYFFASCAISLRYNTVFIAPALLYVLILHRRAWRFHLAGIVLAIIPYIPQLIFNLEHIESLLGLSYSVTQPTLSIRYFFYEEVQGYHFQILHYIKYLFFHYNGICILFTPFLFWGCIVSFRRLSGECALFLLLFTVGFLFLLSFFVAFDTRYAIPALLPCFIWLCLGLQQAYRVLKPLWAKRALTLYLVFSIYFLFEFDFHALQSIRELHNTRSKVLSMLNPFVDDLTVVIGEAGDGEAYYNPLIRSVAYAQEPIYGKITRAREFNPNRHYLASKFLYLGAETRWNMAGDQETFPFLRKSGYSTTELARLRSGQIQELTLYPLLRLLQMQHYIPSETWIIYELNDIGDGDYRERE